jgi:hypothetical protein
MPDKTMSPHSPAYIPAEQRQNSFMKDDVLRTKSSFGYVEVIISKYDVTSKTFINADLWNCNNYSVTFDTPMVN